jgi:hypothetical protein
MVRVTFTIDASDPASEADLKHGLALLISMGEALAEHGHQNMVQVETMGEEERETAPRTAADSSLN